MCDNHRFGISINRVDKIPVPLFVIGLGGTGCDALATVKRTLAERFPLSVDQDGQTVPVPDQTAYLGIDCLSGVPVGLDQSEYLDITYLGLNHVLNHQNVSLTLEESKWVDRGLCVQATYCPIRQGARLMLSRNYSHVEIAIRDALIKITQRQLDVSNERFVPIEIVIITGIGGGTGSGTFLDVAQIVRKIAGDVSLRPVHITGYIVMPDVSLNNAQYAPGMHDLIKSNAYATLKELDFWMRVKEHHVPYRMTYGYGVEIEWNTPPFDTCVLLSGTDVAGNNYADAYTVVQETIADNLLHYMTDKSDHFSYRDYEDNLVSMYAEQTYPAYYGYRTIGAFTKRIPKKPILYYEGKKLLATFIPGRDAQGHLQPDRSFFTDGQSVARTQNIIGDRAKLFQAFCTNQCAFPPECGMDIRDNVTVTAYQAGLPLHEDRFNWVDRICKPAALNASKVYFDDAWKRFKQFATDVIKDPEKGPFALKLYLEDPAGLLYYLNEALTKWESILNIITNNDLPDAVKNCDVFWSNFRHPPLLGRIRVLNDYVNALNTLYSRLEEKEFMEAHVNALRKLILRIKEYLKDGLNPLCTSILYLEDLFAPAGNGGAVNQQDIIQLTDFQSSVDAIFPLENSNLVLTRTFLESLAKVSLKNEPNADPHTSGMSFVCQKEGLREISKQIQSDLQNTFGVFNNRSLDQIMIDSIGENEAEQQQWMLQLVHGVVNSAIPMFKLDTTFFAEQRLSNKFMSIPDNAPMHMDFYENALSREIGRGIGLINSTLVDQINCNETIDKLPLYRYADMEDLRKSYEEGLQRGRVPGIHLVCTGKPDSTYLDDWSLLPSPKPYFLFPNNGYIPPKEQKLYQKVDDLTERALRCGMLTVNDTQDGSVSAEVLIHYADDSTSLVTSEEMLEAKYRIVSFAGADAPATLVKDQLEEYLKAGRTSILTTEVNPLQLAGMLNLENEPNNPFDPDTINNPNDLAIAKENYRKLCIAMTKALIYRRPDILLALERQVPAFENFLFTMKRLSEKSVNE